MTTNDGQYVPSENDMRWQYVAKRMYDGATRTHAEQEYRRWLARIKRDAAREALNRFETEVRAKSGEYQQMYLDGVTLWVDELANWTARHRDTHYPEGDDQ